MKRFIFKPLLLVLTLISNVSWGSLIGSELTLDVIYQETETSNVINVSRTLTEQVKANDAEFKDIGSTSVTNNLGLSVVDVTVDANSDSITFEYSPWLRGEFGTGFFNGYRFTFDPLLDEFDSATIDTSKTDLAIDNDRLTIDNNQLFVNVSALAFEASAIIKIDLVKSNITPINAVPEPNALLIFMTSLIGVCFMRRSTRKRYFN